MFVGEQWVGQVSEELLQQSSHAVDIMEEVLRVTEIQILRVRVCDEHELVSKTRMRRFLGREGPSRTGVKLSLHSVDIALGS